MATNAVEHRGVLYVALPALLHRDFLDGHWEFDRFGRTIHVRTAAGQVRLAEGGSRIARGSEPVAPLCSPVLILEGTHYLPVEECAPFFGYAVDAKATSTPSLTIGRSRLQLEVVPLNVPHFRTRVHDLRPVHRPVELTVPLAAQRHLHGGTGATEALPTGTKLLVRREVWLDNVPSVLATRADETLETYVIHAAALRDTSCASALEDTHLARVFQRLENLAQHASAIDRGPRAALPRTIALTVDMCWSLRPFERDFFRFVPRLAARDGAASIALFMTGRWLAQHPLEMERLIDLSREPGVGVTWALHSWVHPKEHPFMNGYSSDDVRADNLRLERDLLEWGIVPSIFYRFPGLVHDESRLRAIRALDLISVDCESWVASMRRDRPPHHLQPRDGSILLIHGNGNEPVGIPRLYEWLIEHPGWKLGPLHRFIADRDDAHDCAATTRPTTRPEPPDWRTGRDGSARTELLAPRDPTGVADDVQEK